MQNSRLIFESSPWLLGACILAGSFYAYLLYSRKSPWGKQMNLLLAGVRFLTVTLLASLLVSPILKLFRNAIEEPITVVALDNSASISEVLDTAQRKEILTGISGLADDLTRNYELNIKTFQGEQPAAELLNTSFDQGSSDLHKLLSNIQNDYEGRNLAAVVLVSDGIYNAGISPTFARYPFKIYTMGVGDTVKKKDILIRSLQYNKISYQGNKFPLIAEVINEGFEGEKLEVNVSQDDELLATETITVSENQQVSQVKFILEGKSKGLQRYEVTVQAKTGEFSYNNNVKQAYVEIIEGREKILLMASSPHPDIKAFREAIESNQNYEFHHYIPGIMDFPKEKFDLVIMHQTPAKRGGLQRLITQFEKERLPILYVVGSESNLQRFSIANGVINLRSVAHEYDNVIAAFNPSFSYFTLSDALITTLKAFPPVTVPFGEIDLLPGSTALLYQQVGSIQTSKPLLAVKVEDDRRKAVILGDGLWRWKLNEYAQNENNQAFNELITKLVQFLSTKEDRRKFRVYPIRNEFFNSESVVFESEVYNDLYERVYGDKIDLLLVKSDGERKQYSYMTNENNTRYTISGLEEGVYSYVASAQIAGQREEVRGEFLVKDLQIEKVNLTADFEMLRKLADNNGGDFYPAEDIDQLTADLNTQEAKGIIHTEEDYLPIINLKWIFFLLLALITFEWVARKYSGGY